LLFYDLLTFYKQLFPSINLIQTISKLSLQLFIFNLSFDQLPPRRIENCAFSKLLQTILFQILLTFINEFFFGIDHLSVDFAIKFNFIYDPVPVNSNTLELLAVKQFFPLLPLPPVTFMVKIISNYYLVFLTDSYRVCLDSALLDKLAIEFEDFVLVVDDPDAVGASGYVDSLFIRKFGP